MAKILAMDRVTQYPTMAMIKESKISLENKLESGTFGLGILEKSDKGSFVWLGRIRGFWDSLRSYEMVLKQQKQKPMASLKKRHIFIS